MEVDTARSAIDQTTQTTKRTRDLRLLAAGIFCAMLGNGAFSAAYTNFIVQVVHLKPAQLGIVEALRESPGLIIAFVAAATMSLAEPIVAAAALVVFAIGIGAYYGVNSVPSLVLWSVVWSIGLHLWMTLQPSMSLHLGEKGSKGKRLGQLISVASLGTILGMALVLALGPVVGFRPTFIFAAVLIAVGAALISRISKDIGHANKPRLVLKWKYSLYYMLTMLEGCRKQVFITFAIFLLVRNYHTSMRTVAFLMIVNNIANLLLSPWIGKMIDKFGERRVLAICYAASVPVFLGYAQVTVAIWLYVLYCLDNLFYIGSMGSTTYLNKIADSQDVMPTLAMGVSMNHLAAVIVPLVGAMLWAQFGHAVTFYGGGIVAAISVLMVLKMRVPAQGVATGSQQPVTRGSK